MSLLNKRRTIPAGAVIVALLSVGLLVGGVWAYTMLTGSTSGVITSTTTSSSSTVAPALLQITGASTDGLGATCSYSAYNAQCSGWTLGQAASTTMTITVENTGGTAASPSPSTSGTTPSDATCVFTTAPSTIAPGDTANFILTYTAGQTTGSASCGFTIA